MGEIESAERQGLSAGHPCLSDTTAIQVRLTSELDDLSTTMFRLATGSRENAHNLRNLAQEMSFEQCLGLRALPIGSALPLYALCSC